MNNNYTTSNEDSVLRVQDLYAIAAKFASMPKPIIGIVCDPRLATRVRKLCAVEADHLFGEVPVYAKEGEPGWKSFTDHRELRRYLAE